MKYTIISIDDSRKEYKDAIRKNMAGTEEVSINCLDARPPEVDLSDELSKLGVVMAPFWKHMPHKRGDIGGFVGHFNAWEKCIELDEPLVVFEDDAIIPDNGTTVPEWIYAALEQVGEFDFLSLCVNDYGKFFYTQAVDFDAFGFHVNHRPLRDGEENMFDIGAKDFVKVYQPWTLTAAYYTPKAAKVLRDTIRAAGLYMNADAFVMHQARLQKFRAIAPVPTVADSIVVFNEGHSIIQSNKD